MSYLVDYEVAVGEAAAVTLPVTSTVTLNPPPPDDSVNTNRVIVSGNGTVNSLGPAPIAYKVDPDTGNSWTEPWQVKKQVTWQPTSTTQPIILTHNPPSLTLLGAVTRTIIHPSIGNYYCDANGNWTEESITDTTQAGGGGGAGPPGPPGPQGATGPVGPQGAAGAAGSSSTVFTYNFNTATTTPPANGEVRLNASTQPLATSAYIAYLTEPGNDATVLIKTIRPPSRLYLQHTDNSAYWQEYEVTAAAVDNGTYATIAVSWVAGGTPLRAAPPTPTIYLNIVNEGTPGATGVTGPQGPQGNSGPQGPQGVTGPAGSQGPVGATGSTGPQGVQGATGVTGPQGIQGNPGTPGAIGATGSTGPQGIQGVQGVTGPTGPTGPPGTSGPAGTPGATGPGYLATSTTNVPIATGPVTVTTQTGLAYQVGCRARLSVDANNWMEGPVTAYNSSTGTLSVNVDYTSATVAGVAYANGFVNKFRNPGMDVAQRGVSGTSTIAGSYTLDGWIISSAGIASTWSQQYNANLSGNALRINCRSGMTTCTLIQRIESNIAVQLLNYNKTAQPVTVQFTIFNSSGVAITPQIATSYPTARDNFASVTADLAATNLQSIPNNSFGTVAYTFIPSLSCQLGYAVNLLFGGQLNAASGYVDVSYADIRATLGATIGVNGSPPPTVELRHIQQELAFCQRYYYDPTNGASTAYFISAGDSAAGGTYAQPQIFWPVLMRGVPTVTLRNGSYTNASSITVWGAQPMGFVPSIGVSAAGGWMVVFALNANIDL